MLHEEARAVLFMMKSRQGFFCNVAPTARVQFPYIAAALAIMCGYFRKKNKKPNYCAAAAAFGMWTQHPVSVRDWVTCLSLLEKGIEMAADEEDWRYMAWQLAQARRQWESPEEVKTERRELRERQKRKRL